MGKIISPSSSLWCPTLVVHHPTNAYTGQMVSTKKNITITISQMRKVMERQMNRRRARKRAVKATSNQSNLIRMTSKLTLPMLSTTTLTM
jgi:ribosomal protein S17